MKFYITKYALTQGIIVRCGDVQPTRTDVIHTINGVYNEYFHKPFWHVRKEDAIEHAEKMRDSKLKSLAKQIERLENLKFYKD